MSLPLHRGNSTTVVVTEGKYGTKEDMRTYTFEEAKDLHIGKIGTSERDAYEREVAEARRAYLIGEAVG